MSAAFLQSALLARNGFVHGFSLRRGGVSAPPFDTLNLGRSVGDDPAAVEENHRRLAQAIGYDLETLFEVEQVHGADTVVIEAGRDAESYRRTRADAIIATAESRLAVGVRTADCVPVLMAHVASGAVAAVHVGWRGAVAGVLRTGLARLLETAGDVDPTSVVVALGPHIHLDAFEVGDEVADALIEAAPGSVVIRRGDRRPHADLAGVCKAQLYDEGVPHESVEQVGRCTYQHAEDYFSHRRDGAESGRHLSVIVSGPPMLTAA